MAGKARPTRQRVVTRVVFDCMVFLQAAARSAGPSAACLQAVREGRFQLLVRPEIIAEVRDVMARPKTLRKFPTLTVEGVEVYLRSIEDLSVMVFDAPRVWVLERDPKDEPYLNLAITCGADYLATWDKDLLDLMHDDTFRRRFPAPMILEPPALLRSLLPSLGPRLVDSEHDRGDAE